jgi:LysM repeat protein
MSNQHSRSSGRRPNSPLLPEGAYPNIPEPKEGHTAHLLAFLSVLLVLGFGFWAAVGNLVGSNDRPAAAAGPVGTAQPTAVGTPVPGISMPTSAPAATPESTPAPAATAPPDSGRVHVVGQGDNLYRISQQYGTTIEAIMEANNITDRSHILHIGDRLNIP